tara:strand:- start:1310 stop:2290 length:981 start_codon:yes stop_codon:yes gene_type:complete
VKNKPLLIVLGEPNSIFSEILFKAYNKKIIKNFNRPIVIIGSENLLKKQMEYLGYSIKIKRINLFDLKKLNLNKNYINVFNIDYKFKKVFDKISSTSSKYINNCFNIALKLINKRLAFALINGPVSKTYFLKKKYLGITEFLAAKTKIKKRPTMLIYNSSFSVCPITTHLPINLVSKNLTKNKIVSDVININNFYKKKLNKKVKFAILGLNPHCESIEKLSEEDKIIKPAIKFLIKNKISVNGPFSADTFFSKTNLSHYDVAIGMYHDQVLTPMKTIFNFKATNLTLGLPFLRVSPDHGTNNKMIGKNKSDAQSLIYSINFFRKIK